jgi:hypothetical protein
MKLIDIIFESSNESLHENVRGYTDQELIDKAKEFNTRTEFFNGSGGAYSAAKKRGPFVTDPKTGEVKNTLKFFNDITSHMVRHYGVQKRIVYSFEFYDDKKPIAVYVGLTYDSNKRKEQHLSGIGMVGKENLTSVTKFLKENPNLNYKFKELTDYVDAVESVKLEDEWVSRYNEDGWIVLNVKRTGGLGRSYVITNEKIKKIVNSAYKNEGIRLLDDFRKKYNNKENGFILDKIYARGLNRFPFNYLEKFEKRVKTDDELLKKSKEYKNINDLYNKNLNLYASLRGRGLIPTVRKIYNDVLVRYDVEDDISKAKEYKTYSEFSKDVNLYNRIREKKQLPLIKQFFNFVRNDLDGDMEKALSYDTYREFTKDTPVYRRLKGRKLLDKIKELFVQREKQTNESNLSFKNTIIEMIQHDVDEIATKEKELVGKGAFHNVYPSNKNPNMVYKIGFDEDVNGWVDLFKSRPDIFPKVYGTGYVNIKLKKQVTNFSWRTGEFKPITYNPGDTVKVKYVGVERLNTEKAKQHWNSLANVVSVMSGKSLQTYLTSLGMDQEMEDEFLSIGEKIKETGNDFIYNIFVEFYNLIHSVYELKPVADVHVGNYGYDKDGNLKCLDI